VTENIRFSLPLRDGVGAEANIEAFLIYPRSLGQPKLAGFGDDVKVDKILPTY